MNIDKKIRKTIEEINRLQGVEYSEYNAMNNDPTPEEEMFKLLKNLLQDCQKQTRREIEEEEYADELKERLPTIN